jgi:hypothetical protein
MAWDVSRPVPWKRLVTPFLIYAGVATVLFSFFGKSNIGGIVGGVLIGGMLYLGVAVIMVKFGWNPPSFGRQAREAGATTATRSTTTPAKTTAPERPRAKPSPTSRTNAGNRRAPRRR